MDYIPVDKYKEDEKRFWFRYALICFLAWLIMGILMILAAYFKIPKPENISSAYICSGIFLFTSGLFAGFLLKEI